MLFQILLVLSIRFFLFDVILFKNIRNYLHTKGYFFRKLLSCPFCQGFWCGSGVFLTSHVISINQSFFLYMISFGFVTAYLSLVSTAIFYPLIENMRKKSCPLIITINDSWFLRPAIIIWKRVPDKNSFFQSKIGRASWRERV